MMLGIRQVVMLLVGAAVVLFAVFNGTRVEVNLGLTLIQAPLSLVILVPTLAGVAIGWLGAGWRSARKRRRIRQDVNDEGRDLSGPDEVDALGSGEPLGGP
jgi:uncharacterized integral membrane protein